MSIENLKTFGEFAPPVRETALHCSLRQLWETLMLWLLLWQQVAALIVPTFNSYLTFVPC